ncbi:hypothetical protein QUF84_14840 [Fictibacillus enclensis]|uniref:hypothetical protein n=1 Tax=Fictibacillus enclensis TaxID=1017270 RepID=UPI0025A1E221|nr:hypothetical protein [Fictibacillus enclensis]MDM5338491.1 hypothetical protein [Fictibacillus enclensis]
MPLNNKDRGKKAKWERYNLEMPLMKNVVVEDETFDEKATVHRLKDDLLAEIDKQIMKYRAFRKTF